MQTASGNTLFDMTPAPVRPVRDRYRAVVVLGTVSEVALNEGCDLSAREREILERLEADSGVDLVNEFALLVPDYYGMSDSDVPLWALRQQRDDLKARIRSHKPDLIIALGELATRALALCTTTKYSPYDTRLKLHKSWDYPEQEIWTSFGLEAMTAEPTLIPWVVRDVQRAVAPAKPPHPPFQIITDPNVIPAAADLANAVRVSFDTETYPGLNPFAKGARVRWGMISLRHDRVWVLAPPWPDWFVELLKNPNVEKAGSNPKFDKGWAYWHLGFRVENLLDTHTQAHVLDATRPSKGLKSLTLEYTNYGDYSLNQERLVAERGGWEHISDQEMIEYAGYDGIVGLPVAAALDADLKAEGLTAAAVLSKQVYNALSDIELTGMCVDLKVNAELGRAYTKALGKLAAQLRGDFGAINFDSPAQVADAFERVYPTIDLRHPKDKKRTTDRKVVEREAKRLGDLAPGLLRYVEWKQLEKLKTSFIDPIPDLARRTATQAFIHPKFHTDRVKTYRLSSSEPNAQNIPKNLKDRPAELNVKRQFISRFPGGSLVSADQSQIELRVLACRSGDKRMIQQFLDGGDIHTQTAAAVFGVFPDAVTDFQRQAAKMVNFLIVYGGGAGKLAMALGIRKKQAQKIINDWMRTYPGIAAYIEAEKYKVMDTLSVEVPFGFRCRYADVDWESPEGWSVLRRAVNAPIQGGAVYLTLIPMIHIARRLEREGFRARVVNQVHDEVITDTPAGEVMAVGRLMREEMVKDRPEYHQGEVFDLQVPLVCDVEAGPNWAELEGVSL